MDKPLTSDRKGLKVQHKKIVPQILPKGQSFEFIELSNYIHRRELTEALEILAQSQIEGDLAIFGISNLLDLLGRTV